jgi:serine/alanine adding enzyme
MRVESSAAAPAEWDAYVEGHAEGTAYHRAASVRIGAEAFGLRTFFLWAHDEAGRIVGVLPLVEQSSLLFGHFLISVPYFTYGGILADTEAAAAALAREAAEVGARRGVAHVELRHSAPQAALTLPERLDKVSMVLSLPPTEAELSKQLGSKLRSQIKRAEREQVEIAWGGVELLPEFYQVFAPAMHRLGTPVYSRRFFEVACRAFGPLCAVLVVRGQGEPQAAAIVVRHRDRIEVPWAAATEAAKRGAINMRMYWEMLRYSIGAGAQAFDFGRSTVDSGTYRFKAQLGATAQQLHWHYWLRGGGEVPKLNQSNPKYARAADLWRRMPLWCANLIGPYIVRNLP